MAPYGGLGMWVWEADHSGDPDSFCATLAANNYSWVVVKAHDGGSAFNSGAQIDAWKTACRKHGLKFGLWGYIYRGSDANMAVQAVAHFGADFYVADAEHEIEVAAGPESRIFCETFRSHEPKLPATLSTFGRIDLHSGIDFASWKAHGFDLMPQAYACESGLLAPALCVTAAERVWQRSQIYPTLGSYQGALGILSGQQLLDSVAHIALPGVNVWDAQELHGDQLEQLGKLAHRGRPPAGPPPAPRPPSWDGKTPFRLLKLTSPLMRGPDVQHLQQAINDRMGGRGAQPIAIDGQYGPITDHMVKVAAYAIGLVGYDQTTVKVQYLIEYPWHRAPTDRQRELQRAAAAAKAKQAAQGATGLAALPKIAAKYVGVTENPPGSNTGWPYPSMWEEHFGYNGEPWCGAFAGSVILAGGGHVNDRVAYCPYIEADAKAKVNGFDLWVPNHDQGVGPGWLVLYCWDGSGVPEHVGVVESIESDHLVAIEGNTSGTNPSDGGMVARMTRGYGPTVGYARPKL